MREKKGRPVKKKEKDEMESKIKELEKFVIHLLTNKRSVHTIRNYKGAIRRMLEWAKKGPRKIKAEDLERYKTYMALEKNYSKNSMYNNIKAIQSFFKFLEMDVAKDLTPPSRPASLPNYLSEEEMGELFKAARVDDINGYRDYAIIVVLGYTGLRVSELCNLNIEDIDFSEKTIKVRSGKGDKDRIVVFEDTTEKALREHLGYEHRHIPKKELSAVFGSAKKDRITTRQVDNIVRKYAEKAGIEKKVTPHVLRHTMATTLLKRGADIRIIQQLLGHSSIATTQIYTHVDERMLKDAYSKAKPKYD